MTIARRIATSLVALALPVCAAAAPRATVPHPSRPLFDVSAFGARCDGSTDDGAAIDAAQKAAAAAGGGIVTFPAGKTCVVTQTVRGIPPIRIAGDHIEFRCNGATLKAASTSLPRSIDEEVFFATVFKAEARTDLVFDACNFDGARGGAADPRMSFFVGVQTSGVVVRGGLFRGTTNDRGAILATSFDCRLENGSCAAAAPNRCYRDWTVEHNRFETSVVGLWIEESFQDIRVVANTFSKMDLAPYVNVPEDYGYSIPDGYGLGRFTVLRGIRFSGFSRAPAACDIDRVRVADNVIEAPLAIEIWNSQAGRGRDPRRAHGIRVEGNTMHSLGGAWVNSFGDVDIVNNTWTRLALDGNGIAQYRAAGGDVHGLPSTTAVFGAGIEARPLTNYRVTGNVLDGGYVGGGSSEGGDFGIVLGADWSRGDGLISANRIRNCFIGIKANEVQNAVIRGNTIGGCYHAFHADFGQSAIDNPDSDQTGNVFEGNTTEFDAVSADTTDSILFATSEHPRGESWLIRGNHIHHKPNPANVTAALYLANPLGSYEVAGNTISGFRMYAIRDAALHSVYDGNVFDSLQDKLDGSVMPFRFDEQAGKTVVVKDTKVSRCNTVAGMSAPVGADPPGQSYDLGTVAQDGALKEKAVRIAR